MREIIDREILKLLEELFANITEDTSLFLNDAQALCAIFMLLYFGIIAYGMISGDKELKIMPLLRPFAITLIIVFWSQFVTVLNFVPSVITKKSKNAFEEKMDEIDAIQLERRRLIAKVADRMIENSAELEQVDDNKEDDSYSYALIGVDFSKIFQEIKGYYVLLISKVRWLITETIEMIVLSLFQAFSYLIFFLQIIFGSILIILGPFAFAASILPVFRDSYATWIARYISVALYGALGYIIMSISFIIVRYALEKELSMLDYVLNNEAAFFLYITSSDGGSNFFVVALFIAALTMLSIPVLSTWIINTTGIGAAISASVNGARGKVKI